MNPQPKPVAKPKKPRQPLRRSWMRKKPARRLKREGANGGYVAWLHSLPCLALVLGGFKAGCEGRIEQSHERNMTGMGRKEPDLRSVPMCTRFHRHWEQHAGYFKDWPKEQRRAWMAAWVAEYNAAWFSLTPEQRTEWDARAGLRGPAQRKDR